MEIKPNDIFTHNKTDDTFGESENSERGITVYGPIDRSKKQDSQGNQVLTRADNKSSHPNASLTEHHLACAYLAKRSKTSYYIRRGTEGYYNPYLLVGSRTNGLSIRWDRVNKEQFDSYLHFLRSKNVLFLKQTEKNRA